MFFFENFNNVDKFLVRVIKVLRQEYFWIIEDQCGWSRVGWGKGRRDDLYSD